MNNNKEELTKILSVARNKKGYSQRKLARTIGVHHSTLNDIENGAIKKIDVEILRKIAEELEIDLSLLLKAAGYSEIVSQFNGRTFENKSTEELKKLIVEYRDSQMDLLDDDFKKRDNVRKCRIKLNNVISKLKDYDANKENYTIEDIYKELEQVNSDLLMSVKKYDYSKLPDDRI